MQMATSDQYLCIYYICPFVVQLMPIYSNAQKLSFMYIIYTQIYNQVHYFLIFGMFIFIHYTTAGYVYTIYIQTYNRNVKGKLHTVKSIHLKETMMGWQVHICNETLQDLQPFINMLMKLLSASNENFPLLSLLQLCLLLWHCELPYEKND